MQTSQGSFAVIGSLLLAMSATSANLLFATASWGQDFAASNPPLQSYPHATVDVNLEPLTPQVEAPSPNKSDFENKFSTRAGDLLPDASLAAESTAQDVQRETDGDAQESNPLPKPTGGQFDLPVFGSSDQPFKFGFGSLIGDPTALNGPTREPTVRALSNRLSSISLSGYLRQKLGDNQALLLELVGGPELLGFDLSYTFLPTSLPGGFSVNLFNQRSEVPAFEKGDRDVDLPNGDTPWVHRLGGGLEYFQPLAPKLTIAVATNYQKVSVRDDAFTSDLEPTDELGNKLTVSDNGQDDLLTLSLAGLYDTTDNRYYPTRGSRVRFGIDQSIPVGDASILYTRFAGNFTEFIPFNLFGFSEGPRTLVLNLQAGTTIGDVPPYDAFNLGGASSVRGYRKGRLATGASFIQATAEYRFPIFAFTAFRYNFDVGGALFFDYGNDLGTAGEVIGNPGRVREKPGDGFGYGFGLRTRSPFGLFRLEFGLNDRGDSAVYFELGDRF